MTLKSRVINSYNVSEHEIEEHLNNIFKNNNLNSENIVRIMESGGTVIVVWDDGERPI